MSHVIATQAAISHKNKNFQTITKYQYTSYNIFHGSQRKSNKMQQCIKIFISYIQDASVNRAILQQCFFFLVRQNWGGCRYRHFAANFNPSSPELNPIFYLLALLAHHFLRVSGIRVKSLTIRLLMSYIYIWSTYS